jgi:SAM-dependent methyltransferase
MLELARRNLHKKGRENVAFVEGDVRELPTLVRGMGKFDIVVCNSAFWQFPDPERLLEAIRGLLKPEGLLAFNLPLWGGADKEQAARRRIMSRVMVAHGIDPKRLFRVRTRASYETLLSRSGFLILKDARYSVRMRAEARKEWARIPAFSRRVGQFGGVPSDVAAEMKRELKKAGVPLWPENRSLRDRWRLIVVCGRQRAPPSKLNFLRPASKLADGLVR